MRLLIFAFLVATVAASCGGPTVTSGEITKKTYDDPDDVYEDVCVAYDKDMRCSARTYVWHTEPARWYFELAQKAPQHGDTSQEKWNYGTVSVDETTYNRYEVGDWFGPTPTPQPR